MGLHWSPTHTMPMEKTMHFTAYFVPADQQHGKKKTIFQRGPKNSLRRQRALENITNEV